MRPEPDPHYSQRAVAVVAPIRVFALVESTGRPLPGSMGLGMDD